MNCVIHFEISAEDPEGTVFGIMEDDPEAK